MFSESDLSRNNNLFAIYDKVYNLEHFDHPGGDDILVFGGRDVTPHYRSLHPSHNADYHKKLLEKYYIGQYIKPETSAKYLGCSQNYHYDSDFAKELKSEIKKLIPDSTATIGWYIRFLCYMLFWFISCLGYILNTNIIWCILFGMSRAFIGLNIMHDANHGSVSKNPKINKLIGYSLDLVGESRYIWIQHHGVYHHPYCEDYSCDPDTSAAEPFFTIKIRGGWLGKYTHILFPIPLSIYGLSKLFTSKSFTLKYDVSPVTIQWKNSEQLISSLIHIIVLCIDLSVFLKYSFLTALGYFYVMSAVASLQLGLLFIVSHNFEGTNTLMKPRYELIDWYKQQVESSCTYGGKIAGWLTGGLNYQIEHHLFPRYNSAHYPKMSHKIREICHKYGVKYTYYPTLYDNLKSTIRYLKQNN